MLSLGPTPCGLEFPWPLLDCDREVAAPLVELKGAESSPRRGGTAAALHAHCSRLLPLQLGGWVLLPSLPGAIGTQQRRGRVKPSGPHWGSFQSNPIEHFSPSPLPVLLVKLFLFIARTGALLVSSSGFCASQACTFCSCPMACAPHLVWLG